MKIMSYGAKQIHLRSAEDIVLSGNLDKFHTILIACEEMNRDRLDKLVQIIVDGAPIRTFSIGAFGDFIEEEIDWEVIGRGLNVNENNNPKFEEFYLTMSSPKIDSTSIWEFLNLGENLENLPYLACTLAHNGNKEMELLQKVEGLIEEIKTEQWQAENIS